MLLRVMLLDEFAMPLEIPECPQRHLADRAVKEAALYGPVVAVQEDTPDICSTYPVFREVLVRDKSLGGQLICVPSPEMPMGGIRNDRDITRVFHRSVLPVLLVVIQRIGHPAVESEAAPIGALGDEVAR